MIFIGVLVPLHRVLPVANALIIYSLTKDVEGDGGDRILYIEDSSFSIA